MAWSRAPTTFTAMDFSPRQWIVIAVLIVGFGAAAVAVSNNTGSLDNEPAPGASAEPTVDEIAWCSLLAPVSTWGGILDGSAEGDNRGDVENLQIALEEARTVAPTELGIKMARLLDLALLTRLALVDNTSLDAALSRAQAQTDQPRVSAAVEALDAALQACGHDRVGG